MSKQALQTIQVLPVHGSLKSTIEKFLSFNKTPTNSVEGESVVQEANLFDFGVRFKIVARQATNESVRTELRVSIPEWSTCREDATRRLLHIYNEAFDAKCSGFKAGADYDFLIKMDVAVKYFDSVQECAESLAQIRTQCIGGPIFYAMERIIQNENEKANDKGREIANRIESLPRCGECRCTGSNEK
jgi:hypothetical protein